MSHLWAGIRRHPWRVTSLVVAALVVVVGVANRDMIELALRPAEPIDQRLPLARPLVPRDGESVFRIDAASSEVRLQVDEVLAGVDRRVALTPKGVAGGGPVRDGDVPSVRLRDVLVDVAQRRGDNFLPVQALQHQFLGRHEPPPASTGGRDV